MDESYHRHCKYCGRWIQLRKMPHGQWVAFEGYDQVHDCQKSPSERITGTRFGHSPKRANIYRPKGESQTASLKTSASSCSLILLFIIIIISSFINFIERL